MTVWRTESNKPRSRFIVRWGVPVWRGGHVRHGGRGDLLQRSEHISRFYRVQPLSQHDERNRIGLSRSDRPADPIGAGTMIRQVILHKNQIHDGHLVLVNRRHPIRRERLAGKPNLVPCIHQTDILLERRAAACLTQLIQAVGGGKDIKLVSGYRSREDQVRLFLDSLREHGREFTEQYVAYPGCSDHETGLAIDLGENRPGIDFIRPSFPDTGIFADFRRRKENDPPL